MSAPPRQVERLSEGHNHRGIARLVTHPELRERLKPFVFLDHIDVRTRNVFGGPFHPHSGVATLTYPLTARLECEDSEGRRDTVEPGGLHWMVSGRGVWHRELFAPLEQQVAALQIWLLLPDSASVASVSVQHFVAEAIPVVGTTRVLAGRFEDTTSPLETASPFNLFDLDLADSERWSFTAPEGHDVAWVYPFVGALEVAETAVSSGSIAVLDPTRGANEIRAQTDGARCLVATAASTDAQLCVGRFSMHTSPRSLQAGLSRLREIQAELAQRGAI